jgi:hypothetical protein
MKLLIAWVALFFGGMYFYDWHYRVASLPGADSTFVSLVHRSLHDDPDAITKLGGWFWFSFLLVTIWIWHARQGSRP